MIRAILRFLVFTLFRLRIVGQYSAQSGHTIIIANHQSFLDGLILGLVLPVSPVFVVNTEAAKPLMARFFLSLSDYIVIDPSNPMAIKTIIRLVESGRPVVIFPEGRITTTGSLMKIYEGSAFVAVKAHAVVLPVIIEGAHFSTLSRMHQDHPQRWFPQITVTYCSPARIRVDEILPSHNRRSMAGEAMRALMQKCLYESRRPNDLFGAFLDAVSIYGASRQIVEDTKQIEYTYKELLKMSLALGRLISRHTVQGEAIGVLMPTAVPTLAMILGMSAFGRIPAMLNFTAGADALQNGCDGALVKTILTSRTFVESGKLESKLHTLKNVTILYLEDLKDEMTLGDKLWLMGYALRFPRRVHVPQDPKDPSVILFTSGSEGIPKGVVLSHDALLANIAQIRSIVDFSTEDKVLNAMPIFHSFGLTAGTLLPILGGVRLFLYPSPLHYRVIPEIAYDKSCTVLFGTSTFLANYAKHAHPYDFYRLRYVVAGAEKLSDAVRTLWIEKFGIRIFEGYGATETAPVIAVNTPMAYKSGTVGQVLPGIQTKLIPVSGIENGGILHVKGANVMSGYLRSHNPGILEAPSSQAGEGWYDTGDIVVIDEEGFLRITGRVKRFAKIAGEMISLESVENLALLASPNHEHAASNRPDEQRGESIILFTTNKELLRDALQYMARTHGYSELTVARKIVYLEAIPLLGTGKTDYVTLKTMASEIS
ncbi:MAG TPA: bifunctional acyl-ACP--phospholipid O-acyltransferase/long-chain-fatty-acid--ACP ligase [Sulfuricurvum sp.]|nr:bifunctional acyl-ACP--phospholipid O-acyltransferase/long-chain-fatty-acid--ACP ligase [Sulfuricurvum sp.]